MVKEILSWVKLVAFTIAFALFFNFFIIVNAVIPSGSMEQTIMTGDRIVAFRLSYVFNEPQRNHIVIFPYPDSPRQELFVKRIVGMPGETITIRGGIVYVNSQYGSEVHLYEPFINPVDTPWGDFGPVTIPEGAFFVMGDNRNNSLDSRAWINTFVMEEDILGRAIFRYYPNISLLD